MGNKFDPTMMNNPRARLPSPPPGGPLAASGNSLLYRQPGVIPTAPGLPGNSPVAPTPPPRAYAPNFWQQQGGGPPPLSGGAPPPMATGGQGMPPDMQKQLMIAQMLRGQ